MLHPRSSPTFAKYYAEVFAPYVLRWLDEHERVDIVWDVYNKGSLKSSVREKRGTGMKRRVTMATKIPGNWQSFLRVDANKQELFMEIADFMKQLTLPPVSCDSLVMFSLIILVHLS